MIYRIFPFHVVEDEVMSFINNNHEKNMIDKADINVDWDYYRALSHAGNGYVVLSMDDNGINGVAGYQLSEDPNNKDIIEASNVVLSLINRANGAAKDFLKESNALLRGVGADKVSFTLCNEKLGRFLKINGFNAEATVYGVSL